MEELEEEVRDLYYEALRNINIRDGKIQDKKELEVNISVYSRGSSTIFRPKPNPNKRSLLSTKNQPKKNQFNAYQPPDDSGSETDDAPASESDSYSEDPKEIILSEIDKKENSQRSASSAAKDAGAMMSESKSAEKESVNETLSVHLPQKDKDVELLYKRV